MSRRVVITGMGAVSPYGIGVKPLWEGLKAGQSSIKPITLFDAKDYPVRFAGEVADFNPLDHFEKKQARHYDRVTQFALLNADHVQGDSDRVVRRRARRRHAEVGAAQPELDGHLPTGGVDHHHRDEEGRDLAHPPACRG